MIKLVLFLLYFFYILLYIFQDSIINFYSDDPKVAYYIKPVIEFYSIFLIINSMQFVMSVLYKSLGYGSWIIKMFSFCFYGIGLTSMVILSMII